MRAFKPWLPLVTTLGNELLVFFSPKDSVFLDEDDARGLGCRVRERRQLGADGMKITRCTTSILKCPFGDPASDYTGQPIELVVVDLVDADDVRGMGFTYTLAGGAESIAALVDHTLAPLLLKEEEVAIDRLWRTMWWTTHRLGLGVSALAIAAIDVALWDLRAKRAGLPLYRYIGAHRDRLPIYGSGMFSPQLSQDQIVRNAVAYVEAGVRAVKIRVGKLPPQEDLRRLRAVRDAVGDEVLIMADANETLEVPSALWLGRRLEDLGVYWLEEPLLSHDITGHRRLAASLGLAISVGEHLFSRYEFAQYVEQEAATILQPDAAMVGGVTEFLKVATLADAAGLPIAPHFLTELHIHLAAAVPNGIYVEYFPALDHLFTDPLHQENGFMRPPDRPGHGMAFKPEKVQAYRVR